VIKTQLYRVGSKSGRNDKCTHAGLGQLSIREKERKKSGALLQNTFIVSAGKLSFVSAHQADIIYTIRKGGLFSISCFQPIQKISIGIGCLNTADSNKCPAWPISKALLVSSGLGWPTPLSSVQIQKNII
jgi:hypothetical protein